MTLLHPRIVLGLALLLGLPVSARADFLTFLAQDPGMEPSRFFSSPTPNSVVKANQFDAAILQLGPESRIDFEGLSPQNFTGRLDLGGGVSVRLDGNQTTSIAGYQFGISGLTSSINSNATIGYNTTTGGQNHLKIVPEAGATAVVTFRFDTAPIQAFGLYLTGVQTAAGQLTLTTSDLAVVTPIEGIPDVGGVQFFGLVADRGLTSVTLTLSGTTKTSRDVFGIDDVRFATVPEPASLTLAGLGLLSVVGWLLRGFALPLRRDGV